MTDLRDARFRRALESAPDGEAMPNAALRRAIRDKAQQAVTKGKEEPAAWWRFWALPREQLMPWNAGFATLLLGVLVAVMWQGEEVPDAKPQAKLAVDPPIAAQPKAPAPAPAPVAEPPPAVATAPSPDAGPTERAAKPAAKAPAAKREAPARGDAVPAKVAPGAGPAAAAPEVQKNTTEELSRARESAGQATRRDMAAADSAAPAAAAPMAAPAPAAAPPPPVAAAAATAPMAPAARAAPRSEFSSPSRALQARLDATLRVEVDGRAVVVQRQQAQRLAQLVDQAVRSAVGSEALNAPVQLRIEMDSGVLEVAGEQVRWTARGHGARTGRPDAAVLEALREEARVVAR